MKVIKIIYYFVATLILIIIGIDILQNINISLNDILFSIGVIIVFIIVLFPFAMIAWEEYNESKNKNK